MPVVNMPRPIYFSGSISGGRNDVVLYKRIVDRLQQEGHRVYAGSVADISLPEQGEAEPDETIFKRDLGWLAGVARQGGALVADVSMPSLGVGYEIATARYLHRIPVICLYRPGHTRRCSAMIAGDGKIRVLQYTEADVTAMLSQLTEILATL